MFISGMLQVEQNSWNKNQWKIDNVFSGFKAEKIHGKW